MEINFSFFIFVLFCLFINNKPQATQGMQNLSYIFRQNNLNNDRAVHSKYTVF